MRRGRHLYVRRTGGIRRIAGVLLILGIVGAGAWTAVRLVPSWLGTTSSPGPETPSATPEGPACATAQAAGGSRLGTLAWVRDGSLQLLDLDTCAQRVLVEENAAPPVRFSHDGRWVAFGEGSIVAAEGGDVKEPPDPLDDWEWSPTEDLMAGVTPEGAVVLDGPEATRQELLPDRAGAGHLAFGPDGRRIAVDVGDDRVQVIDVTGGAITTVYQVSPGVDASPHVAGWSPDGRWVLFWARFPDRSGVPLNAAPTEGGSWANVFDPVLPYRDFLTSCGEDLVVAGGAQEVPHLGNQILLTRPPQWRFESLSEDFSRSWIWPACSPDGRWIVATATPNVPEFPPGAGIRSLWVLSTDGKNRARLTAPADAAFEVPRWSADGRFVLVVRRGPQPDSSGVLLLLSVDPSSGKARKVGGPVARLGSAPGEEGHSEWSEVSDWYRPPSPG